MNADRQQAELSQLFQTSPEIVKYVGHIRPHTTFMGDARGDELVSDPGHPSDCAQHASKSILQRELVCQYLTQKDSITVHIDLRCLLVLVVLEDFRSSVDNGSRSWSCGQSGEVG